MVYKDGRTDPLRYAGRRTSGRSSKTYQDARAAYSKYLLDGPARQKCRNVLQRHGLQLRSRRGRKEVRVFVPGLTEPDVLTWRQVQQYVARLQAVDACRRREKETHTMIATQQDMQLVMAELYRAGYKLIQAAGGYIIIHTTYTSLTAGTEEHPLSLREVLTFAYGR